MNNIPSKIYEDSIIELENSLNLHKCYYDILVTWMEKKIEGKSLGVFFENNNCKHIVVYGIGKIGEILYKELEKEGVDIVYTVDNNLDAKKINEFKCIDVKSINKDTNIDIIIITPIYASKIIKQELREKLGLSIKILSIDELIFNM